MSMPAETVEHLANGVTFHRYIGGDQPVCRLTLHFAGGISEMGEAATKLLLNQLTEGTATRSADDIAEAIDYNGARFATQAQTHFSVTDLFVLTSRMADMLPVLMDMISSPVFPEERLEVSRLRLKNALQTARRDPSAVADLALSPLMLGRDNPLAHVMTEDDIDNVSPSTLKACHRRLVCPARMHAYLSGLADDDVIAAVRRFLESIPTLGDGYAMELHPAHPEPAGTLVTSPMVSTYQCAISCGIPTIGRQHPDYVPLRFAVMALGGYFGSRLMSNIREDKGLTYGITAALYGYHDRGYLIVSTETDCANTREVITETVAEIERLKDPASFSPDEVERLRNFFLSNLASVLDSPFQRMDFLQNNIIAGTPTDYFALQHSAIRATTAETIAETARRYFDTSKMVTSIAGKFGGIKNNA